MEMSRQSIDDMELNYVSIIIGVESGCNPKDGEYTIHITNFTDVITRIERG